MNVKNLAAAADVNMREIGGLAQEVAGDSETVFPEVSEGCVNLLLVKALQLRQAVYPADRLAAPKPLGVALEEQGVIPRTAVPEMPVDRLVLFCFRDERPVEVPITGQDVIGVEIVIANNFEDYVVGSNPDDLARTGNGGERWFGLAKRRQSTARPSVAGAKEQGRHLSAAIFDRGADTACRTRCTAGAQAVRSVGMIETKGSKH